MRYKRITLLCGHYGSGKTNIAVNMAYDLRNLYENVAIADLDIVNPYFRSKDSQEDFAKRDIKLICSEYANSNLDVPALPQEMYSIVDDKSMHAIIDVGGDERGALALGRLSKMITDENDFDMLLVINRFRPLTRDVPSILEVMEEIQVAGRIPFTGIVNNSNLGAETDEEVIVGSMEFAREVAKATGLPIVATAVDEKLSGTLAGKIEDLFPLRLQKRPVD